MAVELTYPVRILHDQLTALEAALSVCLADPVRHAVHRVRTLTRRVEAQLVLLDHLAEVPEHRKQADRLRRELKRMRRAAGDVRDLDVHCKRLEELTASTEHRQTAASQALFQGATKLLKDLEAERANEAKHLRKLLEKHQVKLAAAAEKLLKTLEPTEKLTLTGAALVDQAKALPRRDGLLENNDPASLKQDELHSLRKSAKAARYMAETAPKSATARSAAQHFQVLQQAGGLWHDALELSQAARRYLGKGHELTVTFVAERDRLLERYRQALEAERPARKPAQESKGVIGEKRRATRAGGSRAAA